MQKDPLLQLGAIAPPERGPWNTISKSQLLQYCSFNLNYRRPKRLLLLRDLSQTAFLQLKPGPCWLHLWDRSPQAVILLRRGTATFRAALWQAHLNDRAIIPTHPCYCTCWMRVDKHQVVLSVTGETESIQVERQMERRPCLLLYVKVWNRSALNDIPEIETSGTYTHLYKCVPAAPKCSLNLTDTSKC